jgi:hypothetical protein
MATSPTGASEQRHRGRLDAERRRSLHRRDQSGAYLNPGWGGQAYDAEALYLSWQTKADGQTYLNVGLITGHNPTATAGNSYGRGDFAIDFGRDGSWDFGILTANRTSTLRQGDVVATTNANWSTGLWSDPACMTRPLQLRHQGHQRHRCGQRHPRHLLGLHEHGHPRRHALVLRNGNPGQRLRHPLARASPSETFDIQWTMLCANDIITLDPPAARSRNRRAWPCSAASVWPGPAPQTIKKP